MGHCLWNSGQWRFQAAFKCFLLAIWMPVSWTSICQLTLRRFLARVSWSVARLFRRFRRKKMLRRCAKWNYTIYMFLIWCNIIIKIQYYIILYTSTHRRRMRFRDRRRPPPPHHHHHHHIHIHQCLTSYYSQPSGHHPLFVPLSFGCFTCLQLETTACILDICMYMICIPRGM